MQSSNTRGVRIACNRDEARTRQEALPPVIRAAGQRRLIMPVDPLSDGTWVGVNDAGLAALLLNAYPAALDTGSPEAAVQPPVSRGTIIPALLGCSRFDELLAAALAIDASRHAPFRLVLASATEVAECAWAGRHTRLKSHARLDKPLMFTSSGLGDDLVDAPRRELFEHWFGAPAEWLAEQDAFHRHQWPEAPEISVCMSRPEAHTVSYTVVEITSQSATLMYHPAPPSRSSLATVKSLPIA